MKLLDAHGSPLELMHAVRHYIQDVEEWRLDTLRFFDIEACEWTAKCFADLVFCI